MKNLEPQNLVQVGFSATERDNWTGWRMRPNMRNDQYNLTNFFGLHEDREINLAKPPNVQRILIAGSSVAFGMGQFFADTISKHTEKLLNESGCPAEVLNFGGYGYNIVNVNALIQTKAHQFNPDAVVIIMDLQMAVPIWPSPAPVSDEKESVRQLGYWESLFKRLTEYSVVLTALDNTAFAHRLISESLPFPIKPPVTKPANRISVDEWELSSLISSGLSSLSRKMEHLKAKKLNADIQMRSAEVPPKSSVEIKEEAYIKKRYRELSSIIAGLSAFTQSMGIKLYITTPYGPYFRFTSEELSKFSLTMMTESKEVWGSADEAVIKETELIERALASAADKYGSRLVSMAEFTRKNGMESGEFSTDGIHLTPKGYRHIAETLTLRLKNDGFCSAQRLRKGK